jgi:hypothetical protein
MSETPTSKPDVPASAPAPKGTFDLEPLADPVAASPKSAGAAKLSAEPILDDFDEDADFDKVPEAETPRAPRVTPDSARAASPAEAFVKPGMGEPKPILIAGASAALVAAALSAWLGELSWYKSFILSLNHSALFTLAGVCAIAFAARMCEGPLGRVELAAARMLLAVALVQGILALNIPIPATGRVDETGLALATYALATMILFRRHRHQWMMMAGTHLALCILLWVILAIESWGAAPTVVLKTQ